MNLPSLPFLIVLVAAALIVAGRVAKLIMVAVTGFAILALAAVLVLASYK